MRRWNPAGHFSDPWGKVMRAIAGAIIVLAGTIVLVNQPSVSPNYLSLAFGIAYTIFGWAAIFWRDKTVT